MKMFPDRHAVALLTTIFVIITIGIQCMFYTVRSPGPVEANTYIVAPGDIIYVTPEEIKFKQFIIGREIILNSYTLEAPLIRTNHTYPTKKPNNEQNNI